MQVGHWLTAPGFCIRISDHFAKSAQRVYRRWGCPRPVVPSALPAALFALEPAFTGSLRYRAAPIAAAEAEHLSGGTSQIHSNHHLMYMIICPALAIQIPRELSEISSPILRKFMLRVL